MMSSVNNKLLLHPRLKPLCGNTILLALMVQCGWIASSSVVDIGKVLLFTFLLLSFTGQFEVFTFWYLRNIE